MSKRIEPKPGDIFCIPLFAIDQDPEKYHRFRYDPSLDFAFGRVIFMDASSGLAPLVEIFAHVSSLVDFQPEAVIAAPRLFDPIMITGLQFDKNRWRVVSSDPSYDRERDSGYSDIRFCGGDGEGQRAVFSFAEEGPPSEIVSVEYAEANFMENTWTRTLRAEQMIAEHLQELRTANEIALPDSDRLGDFLRRDE